MRKIDGNRSAERHVRSPRRSHPASDPGASFPGRGFGHGAGQTVRLEPSRHLETPESVAAGGAGNAEPKSAVASMPAGRRPLEGGGQLGGGVPAVLVREFRATRRIPGARTKGGNACARRQSTWQKLITSSTTETRRPSSPLA